MATNMQDLDKRLDAAALSILSQPERMLPRALPALNLQVGGVAVFFCFSELWGLACFFLGGLLL